MRALNLTLVSQLERSIVVTTDALHVDAARFACATRHIRTLRPMKPALAVVLVAAAVVLSIFTSPLRGVLLIVAIVVVGVVVDATAVAYEEIPITYHGYHRFSMKDSDEGGAHMAGFTDSTLNADMRRARWRRIALIIVLSVAAAATLLIVALAARGIATPRYRS